MKHDVAARIKYAGQTVDQAVKTILTKTLNRGDGGIIAVDKAGNITMQYNTGGMARAAADSNGRFEVLWAEINTAAHEFPSPIIRVQIPFGSCTIPALATMVADSNHGPVNTLILLNGPLVL